MVSQKTLDVKTDKIQKFLITMARREEEIYLTEEIKQVLFERANYSCQYIFPHDCDGDLTIHHLRHPAANLSDFQVVCRTAHGKIIHANQKRKKIWE